MLGSRWNSSTTLLFFELDSNETYLIRLMLRARSTTGMSQCCSTLAKLVQHLLLRLSAQLENTTWRE